MSVSRYSFRRHLKHFSDGIVSETAAFFSTPEIK
jgi:hypothetical protein